MKSSKTQIHTKFHKILELRFEDQQLASFSGIIISQLLFKRLDLKTKMKNVFLIYQCIAKSRLKLSH